MLVPLAGGLFLVKGQVDEAVTVEYQGREYRTPSRLAAGDATIGELRPTTARVGDRQVFVHASAIAVAPPPAIYLQSADGGFVEYTLVAP